MELAMEIRAVQETERVVIGMVAPYDETSFLVPGGERIARGAFRRSIDHRAAKIPLLDNHKRDLVMGRSTSFEDGPDGLVGTFAVNGGDLGDRFLENLRNGYMAGLSVGFVPVVADRGPDGVREIREAKLVEVSTVGVPAYEGATLLAVRTADPTAFEFPVRPDVNLAPIPPLEYRPTK